MLDRAQRLAQLLKELLPPFEKRIQAAIREIGDLALRSEIGIVKDLIGRIPAAGEEAVVLATVFDSGSVLALMRASSLPCEIAEPQSLGASGAAR
jgi:hypothetical protein